MRSSSQHVFAQVPRANIPRSSFRRNMTWKTAFDSGYLVPIYVDECLPGDTFNLKLTTFARLSTPVVPYMDNLYMDFFFFYVPNRLLWDNWERFLGAQDKPSDKFKDASGVGELPVDVPRVEYSTPLQVGTLGDYFGLPVGKKMKVCSFWHKAYYKIWNDWFRDENLQDSLEFSTSDLDVDASGFVLQKRGKRHDYFTSCLPWAQKFEGASIGLAGSAPVYGDGHALVFSTSANPSNVNFGSFTSSSANGFANPRLQRVVPGAALGSDNMNAAVQAEALKNAGVPTKEMVNGASVGLMADLTEASAVTINSLRQAFAVQRWCERCARGGTRFTELLRAHFGVISPDARLQRAEYLGGGSSPIQIHSVAQTSGTSDESLTPQGNLAAYGVCGSNGIGFTKSFVEHGVILGLACVRADLTYQQGLHRMWSRRNKFDFYWPVFNSLGEQAVLNKEIYYAGDGDAGDDKVFGYQERWAEYRFGQSRITGKLRSGVDGSLDVWHLAQYFENRPTLSADFVQENPPVERVLAVQDEPQIIYDSLISLNCVRPMGVYSVPGNVDHF